MHVQPRACRRLPRRPSLASLRAKADAVMIEKSASELHRAVGVGSCGFERVGADRRDEQRRRRRGGADPAECPSEIAPKIEEAEMEPCGRFDEDGLAGAHASTGVER